VARQVLTVGHYLADFTLGMVRVAFAKKATPSWPTLEKHAVTAWVWRAIGYAVLYYVNVDSRSKRLRDTFLLGPLDNLVDREVRGFRMLSM
jgi:hypothetical protein